LQITVEIKEEDRESFLELLHNATPACEVVSTRKVNGPSSNVGGLTIENNFFILKIEKRNKIIVFDSQKVGAGAQKNGGAAALPAPPPPRSLLQTRCITSSPFKPQARGNARINNHIKRRKDYMWYWRTLKDCCLWEDPVYQARKEQLGCHIDDVREVMPHCVIKD
ncbi:unnamed protein product, partial [Porites evermanni]